jgi:hypothetical protein
MNKLRFFGYTSFLIYPIKSQNVGKRRQNNYIYYDKL